MNERSYFWVDSILASEARKRMGLATFGCMGTICALAYTNNIFLPAEDDDRAANLINCDTLEWKEIKQRLLEGGDIKIVDGIILPAAIWAKPEMDS